MQPSVYPTYVLTTVNVTSGDISKYRDVSGPLVYTFTNLGEVPADSLFLRVSDRLRKFRCGVGAVLEVVVISPNRRRNVTLSCPDSGNRARCTVSGLECVYDMDVSSLVGPEQGGSLVLLVDFKAKSWSSSGLACVMDASAMSAISVTVDTRYVDFMITASLTSRRVGRGTADGASLGVPASCN